MDDYVKQADRLVTPYDPDWPSPCELGTHWRTREDELLINWQPVRRALSVCDFAGLENALETTIHPDIKAYYSRYWSANVEMEAPDGHASLLFLWNESDVDRLIENLIGHALACQQSRSTYSVFFACTEDDSDLFLTINNESGVVQLEEPGKKPLREVSPTLAEFLSSLKPANTT